MKSIKTKIILVVFFGIMSASVIIGSLGVFCSNYLVERDSVNILDFMAQSQTSGLNKMFIDVEQTVQLLTGYAIKNIDSVESLKDEAYRRKYISNLETISYYLANSTICAMSVYIKYAPEITDSSEEIVWRKIDGKYQKDAISDFPVYNGNMEESVSWYYDTKILGKPIWFKPYYNEDFNEYVISHTSPIYKDGKFIGVIGMDIDFDDIAFVVNSIAAYRTGFAFLTDEFFSVIYHRSIPAGTNILDYAVDFKKLDTKDIETNIYEYKNSGKKIRMICKDLLNGMRLVICVPKAEINSLRTVLILQMIAAGIAITAILGFFAVLLAEKLMHPIKQLTSAARNIVAGNYDFKFDVTSNDEIGELTTIFSLMAKSLKVQFEYINNLAYKDSMTNVKNKRAFIDKRNEFNQKINEAKENSVKPEFSIVVFDVNNLKAMNDKFGHESGDLLIKVAARIITSVFIGSDIFRIGGDEFVAILTGENYKNRNVLLYRLWEELEKPIVEKNDAFEKVSMAAGIGDFDCEKDTDFQTVFERADGEMYKTKIAMKGGRANVR